MEMKKKQFNPFDMVIDNAALSAGAMLGVGMVGKIEETYPSPVSSNIMRGMEPLSMIPMIHATSGVFDSLGHLNKKVKKRKR